MILGAHGLFVFFNRSELHGITNAGKLFYSIPVPGPVRPVIEWVSRYGRANWELFDVEIPHWIILIIIALAILLWVLARRVKLKGKPKGKSKKSRPRR